MKARLVCLCVGLSALLISGCGGDGGPSLYTIEGSVTYKGAPVSGAAVTMVFDAGQMSSGTTGADGKFTVSTNGRPGAPQGTAQVGISKYPSMVSGDPAAATPDDMMKMAKAQMENAGATPAVSKSELPEKYVDPKTSGLTADVVAGGKEKNTFTFPLAD